MISIIICSRDSGALKKVSSNIEETIGVPYEIIAIDNSRNQYSIFEAYNLGAEQSRFDYLCFMHEDIQYHTPHWGSAIIKTLSDTSIGLIGLAGSMIKTKAPSTWETGNKDILVRMNLIQHFHNGRRPAHYNTAKSNEEVSDVVCIDGVWFCCRKDIWGHHRFDNRNFTGFHFYDLDFSMQIFQKFRVCITYNVVISHYSDGKKDIGWIENAVIFADKWKDHLPVFIPPLDSEMIKRVERFNYLSFIIILIQNKYYRRYFLKYAFILFSHYPNRVGSCCRLLMVIFHTYSPRIYLVCRNKYFRLSNNWDGLKRFFEVFFR